MVKWCVYLSVIILMQMTEIGCLHVAWWVCTVWAKTCTHTHTHTQTHTHTHTQKSWMVTLDAINPLDSFNKGPKKMFYMWGERGKKGKAQWACNYCAIFLKLWLILMFLLGDTNGLLMRLKEKIPGNKGTCWATLKDTTKVRKSPLHTCYFIVLWW